MMIDRFPEDVIKYFLPFVLSPIDKISCSLCCKKLHDIIKSEIAPMMKMIRSWDFPSKEKFQSVICTPDLDVNNIRYLTRSFPEKGWDVIFFNTMTFGSVLETFVLKEYQSNETLIRAFLTAKICRKVELQDGVDIPTLLFPKSLEYCIRWAFHNDLDFLKRIQNVNIRSLKYSDMLVKLVKDYAFVFLLCGDYKNYEFFTTPMLKFFSDPMMARYHWSSRRKPSDDINDLKKALLFQGDTWIFQPPSIETKRDIMRYFEKYFNAETVRNHVVQIGWQDPEIFQILNEDCRMDWENIQSVFENCFYPKRWKSSMICELILHLLDKKLISHQTASRVIPDIDAFF